MSEIEMTVPAVVSWLRNEVANDSTLTFKAVDSYLCPVAQYIQSQLGVEAVGVSAASVGAWSYRIGLTSYGMPVDLSAVIVDFDVRSKFIGMSDGMAAGMALTLFVTIAEEKHLL